VIQRVRISMLHRFNGSSKSTRGNDGVTTRWNSVGRISHFGRDGEPGNKRDCHNVPRGSQGVTIDSANLHGSFCTVEAQIEAANVSMDSYGVIVSLTTRELLRSTPSFSGGSIATWAEIRGGKARRK
jgi:hypothetical protein